MCRLVALILCYLARRGLSMQKNGRDALAISSVNQSFRRVHAFGEHGRSPSGLGVSASGRSSVVRTKVGILLVISHGVIFADVENVKDYIVQYSKKNDTFPKRWKVRGVKAITGRGKDASQPRKLRYQEDRTFLECDVVEKAIFNHCGRDTRAGRAWKAHVNAFANANQSSIGKLPPLTASSRKMNGRNRNAMAPQKEASGSVLPPLSAQQNGKVHRRRTGEDGRGAMSDLKIKGTPAGTPGTRRRKGREPRSASPVTPVQLVFERPEQPIEQPVPMCVEGCESDGIDTITKPNVCHGLRVLPPRSSTSAHGASCSCCTIRGHEQGIITVANRALQGRTAQDLLQYPVVGQTKDGTIKVVEGTEGALSLHSATCELQLEACEPGITQTKACQDGRENLRGRVRRATRANGTQDVDDTKGKQVKGRLDFILDDPNQRKQKMENYATEVHRLKTHLRYYTKKSVGTGIVIENHEEHKKWAGVFQKADKAAKKELAGDEVAKMVWEEQVANARRCAATGA